jgi:hypothetical protein
LRDTISPFKRTKKETKLLKFKYYGLAINGVSYPKSLGAYIETT